jgi:hypothetical protein
VNRTQRDQAIYAAGREGLRRRLIDDRRVPEKAAEDWLVAWETEAVRQGLQPSPDYWQHGSHWILSRLAEGILRPPVSGK